ncbi:hypothetical protein A9Q81_22590 [Gammaproteobacteria bacterium 42_54_T18]|nr:hypothetical protein A9Q81_22590 [Gammaproteobacteria bacterium 42_54_T18]
MNKHNILDGVLATCIFVLVAGYFDQKSKTSRLEDKLISVKEDVNKKMILAKGAKGDPGPKGEKGERGLRGLKGDPGLSGKTEISSQSGNTEANPNISYPDIPSPSSQKNVIDIDWKEGASEYDGRLEQDFSFKCHSGGKLERIWGTDFYTRDSSICTAAAHVGKISVKSGGIITIRIKSGVRKHRGSLRNGIKSESYGEMSSSYTFL